MRLILSAVLLFTLTACAVVGAGKTAGSPGYLETGKSVYDAKRYAKLYPASLFDADNRPGVLRLGLAWDERYGDKLHVIISFPLHGVIAVSDLNDSVGKLKIKIDGREVQLARAKTPTILKPETVMISSEYTAEIRYEASRRLLESMLAARHVVLQLRAAGKVHEGRLREAPAEQKYYDKAGYTAVDGIKRFYKAVWGTAK